MSLYKLQEKETDGNALLEKLYVSLRKAIDEELAQRPENDELFARVLKRVIPSAGTFDLREDFQLKDTAEGYKTFLLGFITAQRIRELGTNLSLFITIEPEKLQ